MAGEMIKNGGEMYYDDDDQHNQQEQQVSSVVESMDVESNQPIDSKCYDDDGRPKRTGIVWFFFFFESYLIDLTVDEDLKSFCFGCRNCVDGKCTYHNSGDWVWSVVACMGHSSTWLDCRSFSDDSLLLCHLLHLISLS